MRIIILVVVALSLSGCYGYHGGGVPSDGRSYIQRQDAYGLGVHMDQYGAPVRVVPR